MAELDLSFLVGASVRVTDEIYGLDDNQGFLPGLVGKVIGVEHQPHFQTVRIAIDLSDFADLNRELGCDGDTRRDLYLADVEDAVSSVLTVLPENGLERALLEAFQARPDPSLSYAQWIERHLLKAMEHGYVPNTELPAPR